MTDTASQTGIVNVSLTMLGESTRIAAMNDGSRFARHAGTVWDFARDEALEGHPWNFAIGRAMLAASADYTPASGYDFAYELPADFLRWLPHEAGHEDYFEGEQESGLVGSTPRRFIVSSAEAPIHIRYIRRVENVAIWSASFRIAMAAKLAKYMAKAVTGQSGMMAKMDAEYEAAVTLAKRNDGLASGRRSQQRQTRSSWLGARQGWNG